MQTRQRAFYAVYFVARGLGCAIRGLGSVLPTDSERDQVPQER
jgi:hypothetical protein